MNLEKLIEKLPNELDGVLISAEENRKYFTSFSSTAGYLLATKNGSVFLTDSRYIEAARSTIECCEVAELKKLKEQLPDICRNFNCKRMGVETHRMTIAEFRNLKNILPEVVIVDNDIVDTVINNIRAIKSTEEINKIKEAQSIAEKAFEHILKFIKGGVTEKEIALELDFFMLKNGAKGLSFDTIVVSGENSSMPHGVATEKKIKSGDFITMDYGAVFDGYHSDMTRTVAIGEVNAKQIEAYNIVLTAQLNALKILKAGVTCKEGDAAAREVITAAGYGENFRHSTGHGVGIEIHENPSLSPSSDETLTVGNVVTVEPGIYLPGEFGVRIEDMAVIVEDGYENLTHCTKELIVLEG